MPQPRFSYAIKSVEHEFEGRSVSTIVRTLYRTCYASLAGAKFAARLRGGYDDETTYGQIEELVPGTVYDHRIDEWVPGLQWHPVGWSSLDGAIGYDDEFGPF